VTNPFKDYKPPLLQFPAPAAAEGAGAAESVAGVGRQEKKGKQEKPEKQEKQKTEWPCVMTAGTIKGVRLLGVFCMRVC
jgi:hypothetical protein